MKKATFATVALVAIGSACLACGQGPEGGGMSQDIQARIADREAKQSGSLFVEAVIIRPSDSAKYWWIRHLENGEVVKSERYAEEPKARERWAEIQRSYTGGAA